MSIPSIVFVSIVLTMCNGCGEVQEKHFDTFAKAKEANMVENGWLPSVLPVDTKQVRLLGDIDVASVYGSFVSETMGDLQVGCSQTTDLFHPPRNGPSWFPRALREAKTSADIRSEGYQLLFCDRGEFTVAFQPAARIAYYWSIGK